MLNDQNRQAVRKVIQQRRTELSQVDRDRAATFVADYLTQSTILQQSNHIACYLATNAEIDTRLIIEAIFKNNKKCYLPVIDFKKTRTMDFIEYQNDDILIKNKFGILEPILNEEKMIAPEKLDLVIMPLAAFDLSGNRIGSGGGYYDYAFSFMHKTTSQTQPFLCGLAYSFQEVPEINAEPWDIKMDAVLTEKGLVVF